MIANDKEFQGTQERVTFFYRIVGNIRAQAKTPEEYRLYANSYLSEIEKLNAEVLIYLKCHPSELPLTEAA